MAHEDLRRLVVENFDPGEAGGMADVWHRLAATFTQVAVDLRLMVTRSESGWTGEAAEAARAALTRFGEFAGRTGDHFATTARAAEDQITVAVEANRRMPEPVPFDPRGMFRDAVGSGNPLSLLALPLTIPHRKALSDEAKQEAVRVLLTRDEAMRGTASTLPELGTPPTTSDDQGVTTASITAVDGFHARTDPVGTVPGGTTPAGTTPTGTTPTGTDPTGTTPGRTVPGATPEPDPTTPGAGRPGPGRDDDTTTPEQRADQDTTRTQSARSEAAPAEVRSGDRPGETRSGPAVGVVPMGGRPGGGPPVRPRLPAGGTAVIREPGARAAAARIAGPPPARPGAAPLAPVPPGGPVARAEDREHTNRYLVATDEYYLDPRLVAPSTIGEE
ncbi:PPE domain-containing protein [Saccharothrix violaceirubra]|uniref:PPE domain-containing protein n=1 Tax=Saccharothrix violaceirubra TaxID=413306 RepID=A0A7W7T123_9PSEU|nr:PPE domain-containing protein [Saccharothrix violaceirubra]MBB4964613.1 hypothetical protein [Saccharothrix violaceirubra]